MSLNLSLQRAASLALLLLCLLLPVLGLSLSGQPADAQMNRRGHYQRYAPPVDGGIIEGETVPFTQSAIVPGVAPYNAHPSFAAPRAVPPPTATGDDYFDEIEQEGAYPWLPESFPLKVYIAPGDRVHGYRQTYRQILIDSFNAWANASGGKVAWTMVTNPREADVVCNWIGNARGAGARGGVEGGRTATVVVKDRRFGEYIESASMELLTFLHGRPVTDNELRKAALHEVGHAFGLQGHSTTCTDILFHAVRETQKPYLQARDINTLLKLYASYPSRFSIGSAGQPQGRT